MRPKGVADAQTVEIPSPPKELSTGTLAVDLGCFPFDNDIYLTLSDSQASILWHSEFDRVQ